jgi:hypothetical protein
MATVFLTYDPRHNRIPLFDSGRVDGTFFYVMQGDSMMAVSLELEKGQIGQPRALFGGGVSGQSGVDSAPELRRLARRGAVSDDEAAGRPAEAEDCGGVELV